MKKIYLWLLISLITSITMGQNIAFEQVGPPPPAPSNIANFEGVDWSSIAFADIDNDLDLDVLITGNSLYGDNISKLYNNDGNGNYTELLGTPFDSVRMGSVAFADINNDNYQDVLITGINNADQLIAKLYTNNGSGIYSELMETPFEGVGGSSIAFADIDNDNDKDVLITGAISDSYPVELIAKLYHNDGNGTFTEALNTPFDGVIWGSVDFADIDSDNDQDVLITGANSSNQLVAKLYINNGNSLFTEAINTPFDGVVNSSVAFADVDNDGDQDVLISGENYDLLISKLYTNNGSGIFTEDTETPFDGVTNGSLAFADIDNDNDQDLLITGKFGQYPDENIIAKLYTNDGVGFFIEVTETSFEGVYNSSIAFADIDNDNDQDVLITGENNFATAKLYANDGSGLFAEATGTSFDAIEYSSVAFADIDNDNDQDVLITGNSNSGNISKLYTNDGIGNYTEVSDTPFENVSQGSVAFADIDNDNDQDVLISGWTNNYEPITKLYTNNGNGFFMEVLGNPFNGVSGGSIAFVDIDNDNDQDVLILAGSENLFSNDGNGVFTEVSSNAFEGISSYSFAFADINNDSDQDVLVTGISSDQRSTKLYTNDGNGFFEEVLNTPFDGLLGGTIIFADIDNDNDQDVLITGQNSSEELIAKIYTNDGSGFFEEAMETPFDGVINSSIAFADIDNDNDQDVLITGDSGYYDYIAKLYTNNGNGLFTEVTGMPFDGVGNSSIAFADIDNDNDKDLLITGSINFFESSSKLFRNMTVVGINENTLLNDVSIYPNPATNEVFVSSNTYSSFNEVNIYNQLGQNVLYQQEFNNSIKVSLLKPGIYIIELVVGESIIRKKLMIE